MAGAGGAGGGANGTYSAGNGGLYGGGGGGSNNVGSQGIGAQGIIVITYLQRDITGPTPVSGTVATSGTSLDLTLTDADSPPILPTHDPTGFSITADGIPISVVGISQAGSVYTFTLATIIWSGQVVKVAYDSGTGNVTDSEAYSHNPMTSFSNFAITNNSTRTVTTATVGTGKDYTTLAAALIAMAAAETSDVVLNCYGPDDLLDFDLSLVPAHTSALHITAIDAHDGKYHSDMDVATGRGAWGENVYNSGLLVNTATIVTGMRFFGTADIETSGPGALGITFDRVIFNPLSIRNGWPVFYLGVGYNAVYNLVFNNSLLAGPSPSPIVSFYDGTSIAQISVAFNGCTLLALSGYPGWGIVSPETSTATIAVNDTIIASLNGFVFNATDAAWSPGVYTFSHSLLYKAAPPAGLMSSVANGDPSLPNGSPAIGTGANTGLTYDIIGTARPGPAGYDIGAWEGPGTVGPSTGHPNLLLLMWEG